MTEMGMLPKETAQYVPQILALALVLKNLDRFGYDTIKLEPQMVASDLDVPAGVPLSLIAHAAGTSISMIHQLNPEILRDVVPNQATVVHVPAGGLARARVMLPHLLFDLEEQSDDAEAAIQDLSSYGFDTKDEDESPRKAKGKSKGRAGGADHR
jgi:hypothetical protein